MRHTDKGFVYIQPGEGTDKHCI